MPMSMPEVLEKTAELRKKIVELLPEGKGLIGMEDLGLKLKPTKLVCTTRKAMFPETEGKTGGCGGGCGGCKSACGGAQKCSCENTPQLCDTCMNFLGQVVNFMVQQGELRVEYFLGRPTE